MHEGYPSGYTIMDKSERLSRDALINTLTDDGVSFHGNACRCPFHEDRHASAGIYESDGGVWRFKCHACDAAGDIFDIRARISGRPLKDLLLEADNPPSLRRTAPLDTRQGKAARTPPKPTGRIYSSLEEIAANARGRREAIYRYSGTFAVIRSIGPDGSKTFKQVHRNGEGWVWGAPPKPWPLYNRDSIGTTEGPIVVVEGEKCVEALRGIGIVAVTSACGAGKGKHSDWTPLASRECVLWPDNDEPGARHMDEIAEILLTLVPPARVRRIDPGRIA